jgi:two-component system LytT family response regulator
MASLVLKRTKRQEVEIFCAERGRLKQRIRALIIDDESSSRDILRNLLENDAEFEIAGECRNAAEAVRKIRKQSLDLVFLTVQMPDSNAFEVIEKVGINKMPATILMSDDERDAIRAFSVKAIDYLIKPFDKKIFDQALECAKTYVRRRRIDEMSYQLFELLEDLYETQTVSKQNKKIVTTKREYSGRLAVKSGERVFLQNVDEIDWIEADNDYMRLHVKGKSHLLRETMSALAAKLDPQKFIRVHRSVIVNIEQVKDFQPLFKNEYIITLKNGKKLKSTRTYSSAVQEILS